MKKMKIVIPLFTVILTFCLCACTSEPQQYTIDGMTYSLPENLVLEEDRNVAIQNVSDLIYDNPYSAIDIEPFLDDLNNSSESNDNDTVPFEQSIRDIKYYYNDNYDVSVISLLVPYNNDEIDTMIHNFSESEMIAKYEDFSADGINGKYGYYTYTTTDSMTHCIYLLNDGILYSFDIYMYYDEDLPDDFIDDIINSISFSDDYISSKKITCGDIEISIPDNYQELSFERDDTAHDQKCYGQYGDNYIEFGVCYMLSSELYGSTISDILKIVPEAYNLESYESSSSDCALGKCEFISGYTTEGDAIVISLLDYNGKIYLFEMAFTEEADPQYLTPIINSVKANN